MKRNILLVREKQLMRKHININVFSLESQGKAVGLILLFSNSGNSHLHGLYNTPPPSKSFQVRCYRQPTSSSILDPEQCHSEFM